jgi:hypothetical protein
VGCGTGGWVRGERFGEVWFITSFNISSYEVKKNASRQADSIWLMTISHYSVVGIGQEFCCLVSNWPRVLFFLGS